MADDELDSLYGVPPDIFTAERARLTAAAKERGATDAAKRISAARKPTVSAWIVNRLALSHHDTKQRLADLGDQLRAAHAAMDGEQIRDLSAEQHRLISELTRAAFAAAEVSRPSAAVRDDVTSTLQAAVADPEVRDRLGRLTKAEQWSGFGGFGDAAPAAELPDGGKKQDKAADQHLEKLNAAVATAERAKAEADTTLSERQAARDAAAQRRDEALASLRRAERELKNAESDYDQAQRASRDAEELLREAKAQLRRLRRG